MGQAAYDDSAVRRRQAAQPQRSIPLRVKKAASAVSARCRQPCAMRCSWWVWH